MAYPKCQGCGLAVLRVLRLIQHRAKLNGRQEITLGDIEWAIQELEKK